MVQLFILLRFRERATAVSSPDARVVWCPAGTGDGRLAGREGFQRAKRVFERQKRVGCCQPVDNVCVALIFSKDKQTHAKKLGTKLLKV